MQQCVVGIPFIDLICLFYSWHALEYPGSGGAPGLIPLQGFFTHEKVLWAIFGEGSNLPLCVLPTYGFLKSWTRQRGSTPRLHEERALPPSQDRQRI